jgi:hypothetical protein
METLWAELVGVDEERAAARGGRRGRFAGCGGERGGGGVELWGGESSARRRTRLDSRCAYGISSTIVCHAVRAGMLCESLGGELSDGPQGDEMVIIGGRESGARTSHAETGKVEIN